tara:strand:+ start:6668 stop:9991 length:3324 start_codon:yes stop_codon:yes gene_type:complete
MAIKRTYINSDEELVIKGNLVIEGNVTQIENTSNVSRLESDIFVINNDGDNVPAILSLNSNNSIANISYTDGGNLTISQTLEGNVFIGSGQTIEIDGGGSISGAGFTGNVTGTASNANGLVSAVTVALTGAATGSATFQNSGDTASIATTLADSGVLADVYGSSSIVPVITVNGKGIITSASNTNIDHDALTNFVANEHIDHTSVTITAGDGLTGGGTIAATRTLNVVGGFGITANANDIEVSNADIRSLVSVTDSGGDGSLAYNNTSGVITYTGPSATEVRAHLSGGYGITFSGGAIELTNSEVQAQANVAIGNNSNLVLTDTTQSISGAKTFTSDLEVQGNLNVTANINSATQVDLFVEDSNITLRSGAVGGGDALIIVERGSAGTDSFLKYNETSNRWQFSNDGSTENNILLATDFVGGDGIDFTSGTATINVDSTVVRTTRNLTAGLGLTGGGTLASDRTFDIGAGSGITVNADNIQVDSTVIRSNVVQSIDANTTFTAGLVIPGAQSTLANAIYSDGNEAFVYVGGAAKQITPTASVGTVATVGASGTEIYAGNISAGNVITHGIRRLAEGTGIIISDSSNVITLSQNTTFTRSVVSANDTGGDGSFSYDNSTGVFTYTGPSASEVRAHIDTIGLISFDSDTGIISTNADNYTSWSFDTDSSSPEAVTSGETVTIQGGSGIDVTHSGNVITVINSEMGDITGVTAGFGLSGGGTTGTVSLALSNSDVRGLFSAGGDLSYNSSTGVFSFTNDAGDIEGVTAGVGLSGGGTSGTVTLDLDFSELTDMTGTMDASDEFIILDSGTGEKRKAASEIGLSIFNNDSGFTTNVGDITGVTAGTGLTGGGASGGVTLNVVGGYGITANADDIEIANSEVRALFSASGDISYDSSTGVISFTNDAGDIESVGAGTGMTGGGTSGAVTLNVIGGDGITANANDMAIDLGDTAIFTSTNTASRAIVRDTNGSFAGNVFTGTATQAQYADLAENYEADADYEPGTVLVIGGESEVTISDEVGNYKVVGVVSTDPAHLMNNNCEGDHVVAVALRGRIPCKVTGNVKKGDVLIASNIPGHAMVAAEPHNLSPLQIIGRALANKNEAAEGIVEIIV